VRPNPQVGALIVKDDRIIARGWHRFAGGPHAEIEALAQAGELARGATMYVTLEPCNHHGKTGPCTSAILSAGIRRVVVAARDPNPGVHGQGIEVLRAAGVEVSIGVCQDAAVRQVADWRHSLFSPRPFVEVFLCLGLNGIVVEPAGAAPASVSRIRKRLRDSAEMLIRTSGVFDGSGPMDAGDASRPWSERLPALKQRGVRSVFCEDPEATAQLSSAGCVDRYTL
jgi:diaminohydroxyphosphoribosylaminopyrimidine deaminase/5-amino-6-(5-phosphoribosylamino)uracil reductase